MDKLSSLTMHTFSNTSIAGATELNIFVDVYSIIKSVFSEHTRVDISDNTAITTGLINMCSHYRSFFASLSVKTNFFLVSSFNVCDINEKFVSKYNGKFKEKMEIPMYNQVVMDNFALLELLCPYLPDIHFIRSPRNYESSIIMTHLIETVNNGSPNLIISKDIYPMQLCYLYPYTSYLLPCKYRGFDTSLMVPISEKKSFRKEFWNLFGKFRSFDISSLYDISPLNFTLFLAINGFKERNIYPVLANAPSTKNIITHFVGEDDIKIYPEQMYKDEDISSKIPIALVESRMKAIDIQYILPYYRNDPESKSIKLQNLVDHSAINAINARFFSHNPIDLQKL